VGASVGVFGGPALPRATTSLAGSVRRATMPTKPGPGHPNTSALRCRYGSASSPARRFRVRRATMPTKPGPRPRRSAPPRSGLAALLPSEAGQRFVAPTAARAPEPLRLTLPGAPAARFRPSGLLQLAARTGSGRNGPTTETHQWFAHCRQRANHWWVSTVMWRPSRAAKCDGRAAVPSLPSEARRRGSYPEPNSPSTTCIPVVVGQNGSELAHHSHAPPGPEAGREPRPGLTVSITAVCSGTTTRPASRNSGRPPPTPTRKPEPSALRRQIIDPLRPPQLLCSNSTALFSRS